MSVVKINAINVPEGAGPMLEERFAARAGEVEKQPGFQEFELLRPTGGETRYFVYTRWETEEHFQAWLTSQSFGRDHGKAAEGQRPVAHGADLLEFEVVTRTVAEAG